MTQPAVERNELFGPRGRFIRVRMGIICGLLALGMGLVVSAGFDLMIVNGASWRELAERQRERRLNLQPKRGTLYDRNGTALAVSVEVPSVSLDALELLRDVAPEELAQVARDAATRIAAALDLDPVMLEKRILAKRRFAWLKRRVSAEEVESVRRLAARGVPGQRPIRGLNIEPEGHRYYPRRELAGSLLGFVAPGGVGKDGLELALNRDLEGHPERLAGLRDRSSRLLFADAVEDDAALAGHDVTLSIDQGVQHAAETELAAAVRTFEATGGSVVVLDPKTGELLALASFPSYNPNDYGVSAVESRRARSLSDGFEPGSTMKIFTIAAALAEGAIAPTQQLFCEKGSMKVDNVSIRDTHPAEWLSIPKVLSLSSNICAAKIGLGLGGERLYEAFRRFGFGQRTTLDLPGESSGTLRPRGRSWVDVETAAASFGQGISVTTLQLALATGALANGGELMEPVLVRRVQTASGDLVRMASPTVRRRVVPKAVALQLTDMMIGVTEGEGTGVEAAIEGYQVAGKTATAQKADSATGRYSEDRYLASFVGFVPARDPAVVIAVVIDEPRIEHAGGVVAAPVFRRVAQMALEYRGLVPRGTKPANLAAIGARPDPGRRTAQLLRSLAGAADVQELAAVKAVESGGVRVPDMIGWPMRRVVDRTHTLGLVPEIYGSGTLLRQEPAPGEQSPPGQPLRLFFEPAS